MIHLRSGRLLLLSSNHQLSMTAQTTLETSLLVEDEPAVRQLFAQALTRAGYTVHEARNGQEAMKVEGLLK